MMKNAPIRYVDAACVFLATLLTPVAARADPVTPPKSAGAPPASPAPGSQNPAESEDPIYKMLSARCKTALCFDNGRDHFWLGIEPLVELPVGKAFAVSGGSLSDYVNNHDLRVDLAAGARIWLYRDLVSLSVYLSKPLTSVPVRIAGSSFSYPGTNVHRPYPGFSLGLLYDLLWLSVDRDELRNGDAEDTSARNPAYPANTLISSSWTVTLAIQPITSVRTAISLMKAKAPAAQQNATPPAAEIQAPAASRPKQTLGTQEAPSTTAAQTKPVAPAAETTKPEATEPKLPGDKP
jgi:hypothetical protein